MFFLIIFQNTYVELETPIPFMEKSILNFHFDYLTPSLSFSTRCWFLKKNNMILKQFARLVCEEIIFRFPEGRQLEEKRGFKDIFFKKNHEKIMLWEWLNLSKKIVWVLSLKLGTVAHPRFKTSSYFWGVVMYVFLHQVLMRAKYRRFVWYLSFLHQVLVGAKYRRVFCPLGGGGPQYLSRPTHSLILASSYSSSSSSSLLS